MARLRKGVGTRRRAVVFNCAGALHQLSVAGDTIIALDHEVEGDLVLGVLGGGGPEGCAGVIADFAKGRADRLPPVLADLALRRWARVGVPGDAVRFMLTVLADAPASRSSFRPESMDFVDWARSFENRHGRLPAPADVAP